MTWHAPAQVLKRKTHCLRGHEFTPENIYREEDGYRRCRACKKLTMSAAYRRERNAA